MLQKVMSILGLTIASSINYAFAYVLRIIWGVEIYYFILLVFIFAVLFGVVAANMERTIIITAISLLLGAVIGFALIISPTLVFGESITVVNVATMTTIQAISTHLLFSLVVGFFGAILGFFLGERLLLEAGSKSLKASPALS